MQKKQRIVKAVVEVNARDQVIKFWANAADAAKELRINKGLINMLLEGRIPKTANRRFRWATPEEVTLHKRIVKKLDSKKKNALISSVNPDPVISIENVEVVPAAVEPPVYDSDTLSPFQRMLADARSKKVS